jgi:FMN phosphatase YigB (HAD superfamily)
MRNFPMKMFFCDFDGVLGRLNRGKALDVLAGERSMLKISPASVLDKFFFSNPLFIEIDSGTMSYKEMLCEIAPLAWKGDNSSWYALWDEIWSCYEFDTELSQIFEELKKTEQHFRVVSDNHRDFKNWMKDIPEISHLVDNTIISANVGFTKPNRDFFEVAAGPNRLDCLDVLYVDDSKENVLCAERMGFTVVLFQEPFCNAIEAIREFWGKYL